MTLWTKCLNSLVDVVPADDLDTWIRPLQAHVAGTALHLYAPNPFVLDKVQGDFLQHIRQALPESIESVKLFVGDRPRADTAGIPGSPTASGSSAVPSPANKSLKARADKNRSLPPPGQLTAPEDIWSDSHWAQSSDLVRTALFTANRYGADEKRPRRFSAEIFSQNNIKILVTGEETNTMDEDVFLQLLHYQRRYPLGNRIGFSLAELSADLGRAKNGELNNRLVDAIRRLQKTTIEVQRTTPGREQGYSGQLINDVYYDKTEFASQWSVTFNPEIARLFFPNFTRISREEDRQLRSDLSKRLHRYYSSHHQPYPVTVEFLWKMSGSQIKDKRKFKQKLKASLEELQTVGFLVSWEVTGEDKVRVVRTDPATRQLA